MKYNKTKVDEIVGMNRVNATNKFAELYPNGKVHFRERGMIYTAVAVSGVVAYLNEFGIVESIRVDIAEQE
jgi:hypothetical protein